MKKVVSIILSVLLVASMIHTGLFGITASAATYTEHHYTYTVTGGKATIVDVLNYDLIDITAIRGQVTIPSSLGGYTVVAIGDYAFGGCDLITGITIPGSVKNIGTGAFASCTRLKSVVVPRSITSLSEKIFENCALTNITIPNSVTSIGDYAFSDCPITSITIPSSVTSIGDYAFSYCNLTNITIPNSVTSIGNYAFYNCSKLSSVYYRGKSNQHPYISSDGNTNLENATWYYEACIGTETHEYQWIIDKKETCDETGIKHEECSVCHIKKNENTVIDLINGHDYTVNSNHTCSVCKQSIKPDKPQISAINADSVVLVSFDGFEYSLDGVNWQTSNIFTGLTPNTEYTFYQRIAESENSFVSQISEELSVCTIKGFKVEYDANGGVGAPTHQIKTEGVNLVLSGEKPNRDGYIFFGWAISQDGSVVYNVNSVYEEDRAIVLYAKWLKKCTNCSGNGKIENSKTCYSCGGLGAHYTQEDCSCTGGMVYYEQTCPACKGGYIIVGNSAIRCSSCGGDGSISLPTTCSNCKGAGFLLYYDYICYSCDGSGKDYYTVSCSSCGEKGYKRETERIEITHLPDKVLFLEGKGTLDVAGGNITLYYNDDTSEIIDMIPSMITGFDNTIVGPQTLTVTCNGKITTYDIEIVSKELVSIELIDNGLKKEYLEGKEDFDVTGGKVRLHYNNDTHEDIDLNVDMISGFDNTIIGPQTLTVTYKGKIATYDIEIISKELVSIELIDNGLKKEYLEGKEDFDVTGGKVRLYYNNDTFADIDLNVDMISGFDNTVVGIQTLTVTYMGKAVNFEIEIVKDYTPGDIDGILGVTDADAVYLLYHTFLSDIYPVNQDCDFNGDGEVNDKDAVYLLYHTFLPDLYPIN